MVPREIVSFVFPRVRLLGVINHHAPPRFQHSFLFPKGVLLVQIRNVKLLIFVLLCLLPLFMCCFCNGYRNYSVSTGIAA